MNTHCDASKIAAYAAGKLTDAELDAIDVHLEQCTDCRLKIESQIAPFGQVLLGALHTPEPDKKTRDEILQAVSHPVKFKVARILGVAASRKVIVPAIPLLALLITVVALFMPHPSIQPVAIAAQFGTDGIIPASRFLDFDTGSLDSMKFTPLQPPMVLPDGRIENYWEIDKTVGHAGKGSLKLYHRYWGGVVRRTIDIPIPRGTLVTFTAWVLSPNGGSVQNKWLSSGLYLGDVSAKEPIQSVDLPSFSRLTEWTPVVLRATSVVDTQGVTIEFSTASGHGMTDQGAEYKSFDWATWIDDIYIGVVLNGKTDSYSIRGDTIDAYIRIPNGYKPENIVPTSLFLRVGFDEIPLQEGKIVGIKDGQVHIRFVSALAVERMAIPYVDLKLPKSAQIRGRVRFGEYDVPFVTPINENVKQTK
ncbi:MAG: zf-HC2 domain-containing protein [Fimbriimonadaceae bacterium]|nr:zf-HC2 domain-containing protein [Fimbriimonadaceae bacterium]